MTKLLEIAVLGYEASNSTKGPWLACPKGLDQISYPYFYFNNNPYRPAGSETASTKDWQANGKLASYVVTMSEKRFARYFPEGLKSGSSTSHA
jgi:hypothetical protein